MNKPPTIAETKSIMQALNTTKRIGVMVSIKQIINKAHRTPTNGTVVAL